MGGDVQARLRREAGGRLTVQVTGGNTFDNTLAYWRAIADALERQPARELLLIDELVGPPLDAQQWRRLVDEVGPRLGTLRIAHVKPHGLDTVEYCVLQAIDSGLQAQVFSDRKSASLWLSYGEGAGTESAAP
jgi:hypothetical protein